jgi:hypothetical protein
VHREVRCGKNGAIVRINRDHLINLIKTEVNSEKFTSSVIWLSKRTLPQKANKKTKFLTVLLALLLCYPAAFSIHWACPGKQLPVCWLIIGFDAASVTL